jgi:hypothetical protein
MKDFDEKAAEAVRHFWLTRERQGQRQGGAGKRDRGARSAVTGGAQLDGFAHLISELLVESGIPNSTIYRKKNVILPGFFRPTKEWDLVVVVDGLLLATLEFKSQVGPSFGNNYNSRTEEALGSATDLLTAYREGAFKVSPKPWLGYFMLLEEATKSMKPVRVEEPHFRVFDEFREKSYAKRYELFCLKLVRERLYDAACFMLSDKEGGLSRGKFREPSPELTLRRFIESLTAKAIAYSKFK